MRSAIVMSGVASFSPYRRSRGSQAISAASPASARRTRHAWQIGASGSSLISQPARTGIASSRSPTSNRAMRVLAWPRSPRKTTSCPLRMAFSSWGTTVSS
jgi:hypothetical protein